MNGVAAHDSRVVVLTPTGRDFELLHAVLARHDIDAHGCRDLADVCAELSHGAAALLIAEEALSAGTELSQWVERQPPWSDLPILIMALPGTDYGVAELRTNRFGNVTILDRPTRVANLVSAVQTALRARKRQYQIREYIAGQQLAEEQLRANDRRKDEFLAILAHELRNPLAPISNGLHILNLAYGDHAETRAVRQVMERQLASMKRLVDDLLEVSRVTRGKLELRIENVDLAAIVRAAIDVSQPVISAAQHRLEVELPEQPLYLQADAVRLAQVVANLLNNAAKYTAAGGTIRLAVAGGGNEACVSVTDNGVGIPADLQPKIFDMFMQVDTSRGRAQGGLGIGLTLVKHLVELHGGSVHVASGGDGLGSCFTVCLPVRANAAAVRAETIVESSRDLAGVALLVADDNRDAADTLADVLRRLGASVQVAYGGTEALAVLGLAEVDVGILDIGMPDVDGMTVARCIRAEDRSHAPRLIALTGWGQAQDIRNTRAAGFDHHLTKPVDIAELVALLRTAEEEK
ncbi:MAG TPA: ATP-binding protein [Pseudomonadales bacterium]